MNKEDLIKKYEDLEGVWNANGAEIARQCFLRDLEQLNEIDTKKVTVPQFVADWIEYCQKHDFTLFGCLDPENGFESLVNETFEGDVRKCIRWCRKESNILARAWLYGYTVEKEKRYTIRLKYTDDYLVKTNNGDYRFYNNIYTNSRKHTRKEIEKARFG